MGSATGYAVTALLPPGTVIVNEDALRLLPAATRPLTQQPDPMDADDDTSTVPYQRHLDPIDSEEPTTQNTLAACAPPVKTTCVSGATLSELATMTMKAAENEP